MLGSYFNIQVIAQLRNKHTSERLIIRTDFEIEKRHANINSFGIAHFHGCKHNHYV
jgi:hypothetical protein